MYVLKLPETVFPFWFHVSVCPRNITLTETSGVITSPFYPRKYPAHQNCSWQITARKGNRVKLEIDMGLQIQPCGPQNECACDYLQVHNGFSADPHSNDKICGTPGRTITYYSILEILKVLFVSDDTQSKQYDGFSATYTQLSYTSPSKKQLFIVEPQQERMLYLRK